MSQSVPTQYSVEIETSRSSSGSCAGTGCLIGCGLLTLLLILGTVVAAMQGEWGGAVPGGIFSLIAAGVMVYWIASRQQAAAVDCTITVTPLQARFDDHVTVNIQITAKKRIRLTKGAIALRCQERAIDRSGTSDTTYTHLPHDEAQPINAETDLSPGMGWSHSATFKIPPGLPATFTGRNNFIQWFAHLDLGLAGPLLDLHRDEYFEVLPEMA